MAARLRQLSRTVGSSSSRSFSAPPLADFVQQKQRQRHTQFSSPEHTRAHCHCPSNRLEVHIGVSLQLPTSTQLSAFASVYFASSSITKSLSKWPRFPPSALIWARPTPASASSSTARWRSSPTTRAIVPLPPMLVSSEAQRPSSHSML